MKLARSIALLATVLALTACAGAGEKTGEVIDDSVITTKVKTELLADTAVKGTDINVSTENGVVTLAGVLDNQAAIDKAISIAKNVKGVTSVDTRALKLRK